MDRVKKLKDSQKLVLRQHKKQQLPKARRAYAEWLKHTETCPGCKDILEAKVRRYDAERMEQERASRPSPKESVDELLKRLGVKHDL